MQYVKAYDYFRDTSLADDCYELRNFDIEQQPLSYKEFITKETKGTNDPKQRGWQILARGRSSKSDILLDWLVSFLSQLFSTIGLND